LYKKYRVWLYAFQRAWQNVPEKFYKGRPTVLNEPVEWTMMKKKYPNQLFFGATCTGAACLAAIAVAYFSAQQPVDAATLAPSVQHSLAYYIQASRSAHAVPQAAMPAPPLAIMPGGNKTAIEAGSAVFLNNCAFCHGRDAAGGEEGPDLTRSKLVGDDKNGDKIIPVVRNGRPGTEMPAFNLSEADLYNVQAFIHNRVYISATQKGGRRGVDVADLQTGNAAAGKAYFEGAGGCTKCHSATGDLAGVASRYQGLQLEEKMLYPGGGRNGITTAKVTVTTAKGETISGPLAYRDEFTIGLKDATGTYHSWPTNKVKFTVTDPMQAHIDQFPKYTDDNVHDLMAYIQTLK
jgi:cytochrome c oxidase cbb3-type subunit 3